jgi:hypothetical protein
MKAEKSKSLPRWSEILMHIKDFFIYIFLFFHDLLFSHHRGVRGMWKKDILKASTGERERLQKAASSKKKFHEKNSGIRLCLLDLTGWRLVELINEC